MKERGMIFSGESIRAMTAEPPSKWMTRRVIKPQPKQISRDYWSWKSKTCTAKANARALAAAILVDGCPFGIPGDCLYVKETWQREENGPDEYTQLVYRADRACRHFSYDHNKSQIFYLSSNYEPAAKWRTPLFMPRWVARIFLELVAVRAEPLRDITESDARAEGFEPIPCPACANGRPDDGPCGPCCTSCMDSGYDEPAALAFQAAWDQLNKKRGYSWASNPWVWCLTFKLLGDQ